MQTSHALGRAQSTQQKNGENPVESTATKRQKGWDPKESLATLLSQRGFELVSFWERNPEAD